MKLAFNSVGVALNKLGNDNGIRNGTFPGLGPGNAARLRQSSIEDEWYAALRSALTDISPSAASAFAVEFVFRVFPKSARYRGQSKEYGPDLDNMIKLTIDGLSDTGGRGLGIVPNDNRIFRISASKELVGNDAETGALITLRACD